MAGGGTNNILIGLCGRSINELLRLGYIETIECGVFKVTEKGRVAFDALIEKMEQSVEGFSIEEKGK